MIDPTSVDTLLRTFSDSTDGAALKSLELVLLLLELTPAPFWRGQFTPGHITCTGLVLAPDGDRLLLVHHRRLDRWLLPGGHVELVDADIQDAARREVVEETGALLAAEPDGVLSGIDVHGIPANHREPYHLHHDLLFHFRALSLDLETSEESRAVAWCAPAEFDIFQLPENIRRAYARVKSSFDAESAQ
jgi:8-oxo-dGTP pyrophosphatase MutT (NUDIX family)